MPSMNPLRKQKSRETPLLTPERKRKLLVVVLSLFGAALALYGGVEAVKWYKRNPPKPAADAKPVDIAKYVASDSFMKLRLSEKEAIMERMRPKEGEPMMGDPREMMKSLSQDERHKFFERMMLVREAQMNKEVKTYFKLPAEQREAWMANYVAERDKRRAEMRERFQKMRQQRAAAQGQGTNSQGGAQAGGPPGGPGGGPPPM